MCVGFVLFLRKNPAAERYLDIEGIQNIFNRFPVCRFIILRLDTASLELMSLGLTGVCDLRESSEL